MNETKRKCERHLTPVDKDTMRCAKCDEEFERDMKISLLVFFGLGLVATALVALLIASVARALFGK